MPCTSGVQFPKAAFLLVLEPRDPPPWGTKLWTINAQHLIGRPALNLYATTSDQCEKLGVHIEARTAYHSLEN